MLARRTRNESRERVKIRQGQFFCVKILTKFDSIYFPPPFKDSTEFLNIYKAIFTPQFKFRRFVFHPLVHIFYPYLLWICSKYITQIFIRFHFRSFFFLNTGPCSVIPGVTAGCFLFLSTYSNYAGIGGRSSAFAVAKLLDIYIDVFHFEGIASILGENTLQRI